jgi:hypothetical protein
MSYRLDPTSYEAYESLKAHINVNSINQHEYCVACHKNVSNFTVSPNGQFNIVLTHMSSGDTFKLACYFAKVNFTSVITKNENCCKGGIEVDTDASCRNGQLIAISIGDIFKHYYKTGSETKDSDENALLKRSNKLESLIPPSTGIIMGLLSDNNIMTWQGLTAAKSKQFNFKEYCQQYLVVPVLNFLSFEHFTKKKKTEGKSKRIVNDTLLTQFFEALSSPSLVRTLVRNFLYNETLNPKYDNTKLNELFVFDPPMFVPDILLKFYELDDDPEYFKIYKQITREPSAAEKKTLDKEYKVWTFDNIVNVADRTRGSDRNWNKNPPIWSLRNVKLRTWRRRDFGEISYRYNIDYIARQSSRRYKFLSKRSEKVVRGMATTSRWKSRSKWDKRDFARKNLAIQKSKTQSLDFDVNAHRVFARSDVDVVDDIVDVIGDVIDDDIEA